MVSAKDGRLQNTTLGGFDQLLILGQKYLNDSFKNMYNVLRSTDPESPLIKFAPLGRTGKVTNCQLEPPSLMLKVEGADLGSVIWTMRVKSGTLEVYKDLVSPDMVSVDMAGWEVPFDVPIAAADVKKGTQEYNELSKKFETWFSNGQFSMYKIYLDVTNAKSTVMGTGNYKNVDWNSLGPGAFANWQSLVRVWVDYCGNKNQNLLGLTASLDPNIGSPATFPPTWLNRQTYPFLDPAESSPQAKNNHDYNGLMYLMMADGRGPPSPALLSPAGSGNWLVPSDDICGTFCLKGELFWKRFLLPKIRALCDGLFIKVVKPEVTVDGFWNIEYTENYTWTVGQPLPGGNDAWRSGSWDTTKWPSEQQPFTPLPADYAYCFHTDKFETAEDDTHHEAQTGSNKPHGLFRVEAHNSSWNWYLVKYTPGENTIDVEGRSNLWAYVDYKGSNTPAWETSENAWYNVSWGFRLELTSNDSTDGLNIKVIDRLDPEKKDGSVWPKVKTISKGINDKLGGTIIPKYFPDRVDTLVNSLDTNFASHFNTLQTSLENALRDQGRLFLPGSGSLLFKNGTFNKNGDFITQVRFNGTGVPQT